MPRPGRAAQLPMGRAGALQAAAALEKLVISEACLEALVGKYSNRN